MGYLADFELEITCGDDVSHEEIAKKLEELSGFEMEDWYYLTRVKWYDYEEDIKALSFAYPECYFQLNICGKDGDERRVYAHNGEAEEVIGFKPRIIFPKPYNRNVIP